MVIPERRKEVMDMNQPEYLKMYQRVKDELALTRQEHEAWYRAQVHRSSELAYGLLMAIAADVNGLVMQLGRLMSIEQQLGELEAKFGYDSTQAINTALDLTRRELHADLLSLLRATQWPDEELLILKRRLDAHASDEFRRRKELLAFADMALVAMEYIDLLLPSDDVSLPAKECTELNMRLRRLHEALCNKRAELAYFHCSTPLSTSFEEPR